VSGYAVTKLDEIPRRDSWIPIRDHLDVGAFGVNAYRADEAGDRVISEHTELLAKHEELYIVIEGHATFTVDGEEIDAPTGTVVFVEDPAKTRSAIAKEAGTTVLVTGARRGTAFEVSPWELTWEENRAAMKLYREERYEEAADVLRAAVEEKPDGAGILYNLACFEAMAGASADTVAEHLGRAIELYPGFRDFARKDTDFASVRDDAAVAALLEEAAVPAS
jgi:tetratricopeptide (TPR) repeat protein